MTSHTLSCAILSFARQLLSSSLLDLIRQGALDSLKAHNKPLSSIQLAHLTYRILSSQKETIFPTLLKIINDYVNISDTNFDLGKYLLEQVCGELVNHVQDDVIDSNTSSSPPLSHLTSCSISTGQYGRMIQAQRGVGRGNPLLYEKSLISVCKAKCKCHEYVILSEYLTLAWTLAIILYLDTNILHQKSAGEIQCGQLFPCIPLPPQRKQWYDDFMTSFRSGLGPDILSSWDHSHTNQASYSDLACWSLEVQATMAVASSLCSMYTEHVYHNASIEDPPFRINHVTLFEILSRIPMNIHAVFHISKSSSTSSSHEDMIIEQERIGFAIFLQASSINHCCSPNAMIRYNHHSDKHHITSNHKKTLLEATSIEIIPLSSIAAGDEVTISYGPVHKQHPYNTRQECLMNQFLFQCRCHACIEDVTAQHLVITFDDHMMHDIDTMNPTSNITETVILCKELSSTLRQVEHMNILTVDLLLSSTPKAKLISFAEASLSPLHQHLLTMKMRHFNHDIDDIDMISKPRKRCGVDRELYIEFAGIYTTLLDMEGRVYAAAGRYLHAAELIKEAISLLIESERFTTHDVAIGRERIKLAQLYFNAGDMIHAKKYVKRGIYDISSFVQVDDPDLVEGQCMLRYLANMKI